MIKHEEIFESTRATIMGYSQDSIDSFCEEAGPLNSIMTKCFIKIETSPTKEIKDRTELYLSEIRDTCSEPCYLFFLNEYVNSLINSTKIVQNPDDYLEKKY